MKASGDTIVPENFDDCAALILGDREYAPYRKAQEQMVQTRDSWTYPNKDTLIQMAFAFALRERPAAGDR